MCNITMHYNVTFAVKKATPQKYHILVCFLSKLGKITKKEQMRDILWGDDFSLHTTYNLFRLYGSLCWMSATINSDSPTSILSLYHVTLSTTGHMFIWKRIHYKQTQYRLFSCLVQIGRLSSGSVFKFLCHNIYSSALFQFHISIKACHQIFPLPPPAFSLHQIRQTTICLETSNNWNTGLGHRRELLSNPDMGSWQGQGLSGLSLERG